MTWHLTSDVLLFEKTIGPFLRSAPVRHTLLLTVTAALRLRGPHVYGPHDPILGWWTDDSTGAICGALLRTPPHPLTLTEVPPEALSAAASAFVSHPLTAVNLLAADAPAFTEAWLSLAGGVARAGRRTRLFRLSGLEEPTVPGTARLATSADRLLLHHWSRAFHDDIDEQPGDLGATIDDRLSYQGIVLWESAGTPVSMAAYSRIESGMARIQSVYTPPEHRRQGFGGAVTAAATGNALDAGAIDVVLFTDVANPTSNALYQRLGYRPIEDRVVVEFSS
ncbi:GNAT family N-acetyltransferase [Actinoplanes utahensis]|uniref:N-acetyltransferase domain-containing protein n=1 Tax=Actinoplanes utahensis TaxID=1869 RepID=A0A0A6UEB6_ACTUT|nr:GNAT family N-acetyltransferase [Actinoplanes utahensis]KHD73801.1 hypothetical protein MB27_32675 [Actinoplanes utahensis]GIF27832.1 N-acetyltransferase [Actinoplanes utahensis]